jgi:[acyl-carrier-protein] S-malonyltransferase
MIHAQAGFHKAVAAAPMIDPSLPLVGNVRAAPLTTAEAIRSDLRDQLTHRVRWTESIQWMVSQGVTIFIEMGSGAVLTGLLKRIHREAAGVTLGIPADFEKMAASLD